MKAIHALLTLVVGLAIGLVWLRAFWRDSRRTPGVVIAAPAVAALLGLGHWIAYDFSLGHWAGDFSLMQAVFNVAVTGVLLYRRSSAVRLTG